MTSGAADTETVVPGLFAIGECACVSVHGANRLGSNSLLDIVVFGRAAAERCAEVIAPGESHPPLPGDSEERALASFDGHRHADGGSTDGIPSASRCSASCRTMRPCSAPARFSRKAAGSSTSAVRR